VGRLDHAGYTGQYPAGDKNTLRRHTGIISFTLNAFYEKEPLAGDTVVIAVIGRLFFFPPLAGCACFHDVVVHAGAVLADRSSRCRCAHGYKKVQRLTCADNKYFSPFIIHSKIFCYEYLTG
jgi:hypothetical protein